MNATPSPISPAAAAAPSPSGPRQRVGILTFHNTTNYGATLQCLGLFRALAALGCDPEVIDYRPQAATRFYRRHNLERNRVANLLKMARFRLFVRRWLKLTPRACSLPGRVASIARDRYRRVIVGSDQVWHVNPVIRPFDETYYLSFLDGEPAQRISYAASFGSAFPLDPYRERIAAALARFDHLSVRDNHSRDLVSQIAGRDAEVVADPTLLADFADIERPAGAPQPYAVFYGPDAERTGARALAWSEANRLPLITLGYRGPMGSQSRIGLDPGGWLGLIQNAAMVFTSTFHGSVFAARAGRPFVTLSNPGNHEKIADFAGRLGLSSRVFARGEVPDCLPPELFDSCDVVEARPALDAWRERSRAFLQRALSGASQTQARAAARA